MEKITEMACAGRGQETKRGIPDYMKTDKTTLLAFLRMVIAVVLLGGGGLLASGVPPQRPNIVYILADDLGYGDVKCLNASGKIATPNMDRLAAGGMIFTDAHGSSSVCTPTRYSILTGRYNWRSTLQAGVLMGYGKPLIKADQLTVAALLKRYGYHSACIGKWHLGMDMAPGDGAANLAARATQWPVDFGKPIRNGPVSRGFDYFYGISGSLDMPPFVYIENDHWTARPTVEKEWVRKGPAAADFEAVDVLPTLTRKAVVYLAERAKAGAPFFLYLALNSPHTPIVPAPEWKGKSGLNDYGDFVMETDWAIGEVLQALERNGLANDTLVIATSDNGCSPEADFAELRKKGHDPSYVFRGMKSDIWDGGHHIPFIARWPGKVAAGTKSEQLICLGDLMATCAELLGAKLPDNAGEDSVSILPALLGKAAQPLREAVVHHSIDGRFAIRQGRWKLELCPGSGGWSKPGDVAATKQGLPPVQLYDLAADIGETHNVQAEHPEIVKRLANLLEKYVAEGRSTPGAPQKNDGPVDIWKRQLNGSENAKAAKNNGPVAD
jgi:arylsulfatase A-like enzyme